MKNQLDLIVAIVAAVLAIGLSLTFMFNTRTVQKIAEPGKIVTADVPLPAGAVVMGNSLAGGNGNTGGAGAGSGRGGFGGPTGPSGPTGGPPAGSSGPRGRALPAG